MIAPGAEHQERESFEELVKFYFEKITKTIPNPYFCRVSGYTVAEAD
jgi:hypothetical protein